MTVDDNDFTQNLEDFCENLFVQLCFRQEPKEITDETISKHYETQREVLRILNPNITSKLTDEDKLVIKFVVFEVWCNHIDKQNMSEHTKKYLKDKFKCSISLYEVPTLAIVNEVYFRSNPNFADIMESFTNRLDEKIDCLEEGKYSIANFSEFGLRRRLSGEAQELAVQRLAEADCRFSNFVGTSNVYLAKKYNLLPVGTMAHEWIMCTGQGNHKHNPAYSNWYALNAWVKEYGILNGTALTDTITTDCFLRDFKLTYATLFSGVRHDSGDPIVWGEKMINHYESLGIDSKTKTLLFSDSLDFEIANRIRSVFEGRVKVAFGIGTYISNDTSTNPLNIVMKVTNCNGQDVAKISDTEGKGMCKNEEYVDYLKRCINWRMNNE